LFERHTHAVRSKCSQLITTDKITTNIRTNFQCKMPIWSQEIW